MESGPNIDIAADTSETKEVKKKDRKPAKAEKLVGAFAVQPETPNASLFKEKPPARKEERDAARTEKEAQESELQPEEKQFVERELVLAAETERHEVSETLPVDEGEDKVGEFRQRVIAGEDSEEVAAEIIEELQREEVAAEDLEELPAQLEPAESEPKEFSDEEEITLGAPLEKETPEDQADETALDGGGGKDDGGNRGKAGGGRGGGATPPPAGGSGARGFGSGGEPPRRLSYHRAVGSIFGPAAYNRDIVPLSIALPAEMYPDYSNPKTAALVSGVIGYLIGKRRGRIKTEKQLLPIQKKLQKEVVDLQWQLQAKENRIRQASREHARLTHEERPARTQPPAEKQAPAIEKQALGRERVRPVAPEAHAVHNAPTQERLGRVVVTAEARPAAPAAAKPEQEPRKGQATTPENLEKHYAALNRQELLRISETIIVDGTSLRKIYENRLVGERGLRRLVTEHFRGHDMKRALRREILEREIDFERDPVMRDHAPLYEGMAAAGPSAANLNSLLQKAAAALPSDSEEAAYYRARTAFEAQQQTKQQKQRRILDTSMALTIVLLLALVAYLFLQRH